MTSRRSEDRTVALNVTLYWFLISHCSTCLLISHLHSGQCHTHGGAAPAVHSAAVSEPGEGERERKRGRERD